MTSLPAVLAAGTLACLLLGPVVASAQNAPSDSMSRARLSTVPVGTMSCEGAADSAILIFPADTGMQLRRLGGPRTCLDMPLDLAFNGRGELLILTGSPQAARGRSVVNVFAPRDSGDAPPRRRILGPPNVGYRFSGLGLDHQNNVYVPSVTPIRDPDWKVSRASILVYALDGDSLSPPVRMIAGKDTQLGQPSDFAFDSRGEIYVADRSTGIDPVGQISVYDDDARENAAPSRVVRGRHSGVVHPIRLVVGPGDTLFVLNEIPPVFQCGVYTHSGTVTVYPPYASGDVMPVRTLNVLPHSPEGLAIDRDGFIYVSTDGPIAVLVFAPGAAGDAAPVRTLRWPGFRQGDNTAWSRSVAVGRDGTVYVSSKLNQGSGGC